MLLGLAWSRALSPTWRQSSRLGRDVLLLRRVVFSTKPAKAHCSAATATDASAPVADCNTADDSDADLPPIRKVTAPPTLAQYPGLFAELSKSRLTSLVVLTAMAGYAVAPGVLDASTLLWTTAGTAACAASANAFNQWTEIPYDSKMMRTRNRVLVRGALTPNQALAFAIFSGVSGVVTLACQVNAATALIGLANIGLYAAVYTPLKRRTIVNTWVGSAVGALPPLMGWTACCGAAGLLHPGAWGLAGILFAWQFPHFNALSWNIKKDYQRAGYKMMAVSHPELCTRVALRYSLLLFPLCWSLSVFDVTSLYFAADSTIANAALLWRTYQFHRKPNEKTARNAFFISLFHLPALITLLLLHKKDDHSDLL